MNKDRYNRSPERISAEQNERHKLLPNVSDTKAEIRSCRYGKACKVLREKLQQTCFLGLNQCTVYYTELPDMNEAQRTEFRGIIESYGYTVRQYGPDRICITGW
jgi:hypothetical protein